YFPQISARLNTERLNDLQKDFGSVVSVGDTVIPAGTRFQNSIGVGLYQKLFDFGARKHKLQMAKADTEARWAEYNQILRDLKIDLIDLYAKALTNYRALVTQQYVLALWQQSYQMKQRLY